MLFDPRAVDISARIKSRPGGITERRKTCAMAESAV